MLAIASGVRARSTPRLANTPQAATISRRSMEARTAITEVVLAAAEAVDGPEVRYRHSLSRRSLKSTTRTVQRAEEAEDAAVVEARRQRASTSMTTTRQETSGSNKPGLPHPGTRLERQTTTATERTRLKTITRSSMTGEADRIGMIFEKEIGTPSRT